MAQLPHIRGSPFESSHRDHFRMNIFAVRAFEKMKIKKKEDEKGPFKKEINLKKRRTEKT